MTPFWRDKRFWPIAGQLVAVFTIAIVVAILWHNLTYNLQRLGIQLGFDFLQSQASFDIGETPISYQPSDSYSRALLVGLLNSLRVVIIGIIAATIVGITVGVATSSPAGFSSRNAVAESATSLYVPTTADGPSTTCCT
uniref:Amino acid ABC transporter permease n=1 Tax=Tolypothrix bouteillei VB521301 TaxID=1479485 RepID=A0A0C1QUE5_9CYAN